MSTDPICATERRRAAAREAKLNGIDFLEVSDDQRTLTVWFIRRAPRLQRCNVRIEGGRRVTGIVATHVERCGEGDPELDACVRITVDRPGDMSTYTLRLVECGEHGKPGRLPLHGFDPRYAKLPFSFKVNCPSELDCKSEVACPPPALVEPEISYLAKDYASFRALILDRLALVMPDWTERHVPDLGITLVELLAYVGDYLSYYQDAVATEAYLETARRRISVRRHVRLIGYRMHDGCNARAWVHVCVERELQLDPGEVTFLAPRGPLAGVALRANAVPWERAEAFRPVGTAPIALTPAHNEIRLWTWGDEQCCLPAGATGATLVDGGYDGDRIERELRLSAGDVLILEEVRGGVTGEKADADRSHRQAVRLTRVRRRVDQVARQPVLEVEWAPQDALAFALCLSILGPGDCCPVHDVSVARGNVVLADHGGPAGEPLQWPDAVAAPAHCEGIGRPSDPVLEPVPHEPPLSRTPVTQAGPAPAGPARDALAQDPAAALPAVLVEIAGETWTPRADLLASGPDNRVFVGELDDEGELHLRFGDGDAGRAVDPGSELQVSYRVGNGLAGNLGAAAISAIAFPGPPPAGIVAVTNPLPAAGGTEPETIAQARTRAPASPLRELQRAITAADYAAIAGRVPGVQRAAAELRWTGSWHDVHVAVDPLGTDVLEPALRDRVAAVLEPLRRIGHEVVVQPAAYVALDVTVTVCLQPRALRGHARLALLQALGAQFAVDRLSFGDPIRASRIVAAAQAVPGVESALVTKLERLFEGNAGEVGDGILRIGALEVAQLDNDPARPEAGRLTLDLRGGR